MGEIVVERAIDRSKYPKTMLYVDKLGNICKADSPQQLSAEEKASRQKAKETKHHAYITHKHKLRDRVMEAKKQAKKELSVLNAEVLEEAVEAYNSFKQTNWRKYEA